MYLYECGDKISPLSLQHESSSIPAVQTVYYPPVSHLAIWDSKLTVAVSHCLCASKPYLTE